jgi:hypothetical protein
VPQARRTARHKGRTSVADVQTSSRLAAAWFDRSDGSWGQDSFTLNHWCVNGKEIR